MKKKEVSGFFIGGDAAGVKALAKAICKVQSAKGLAAYPPKDFYEFAETYLWAYAFDSEAFSYKEFCHSPTQEKLVKEILEGWVGDLCVLTLDFSGGITAKDKLAINFVGAVGVPIGAVAIIKNEEAQGELMELEREIFELITEELCKLLAGRVPPVILVDPFSVLSEGGPGREGALAIEVLVAAIDKAAEVLTTLK